jgi:hypothetical protein
MVYRYGQKLKRDGTKVKKYVVGAAATLLMAGGLAIPAMADQPVPAPGNSNPGIERYDNNPGRQQATEVGAQCGSGAGSGAFGYFGKDNNLAGGANGQQTGLNNSAVCGNRQGNTP